MLRRRKNSFQQIGKVLKHRFKGAGITHRVRGHPIGDTDFINVRLPKSVRDEIQVHCAEVDITIKAFFIAAIKEKLNVA